MNSVTMRVRSTSILVAMMALSADRAWALGEEYGKHDLALIGRWRAAS